MNDPILGPGIEAYATFRGGIKTSRIDRSRDRKEREADWKLEAKTNPENYKSADLERMKQGKAPIGADGHPMERHHVDGTHEGGIKKMTRTDHRYGPNYRKNHPKRDKK